MTATFSLWPSPFWSPSETPWDRSGKCWFTRCLQSRLALLSPFFPLNLYLKWLAWNTRKQILLNQFRWETSIQFIWNCDISCWLRRHFKIYSKCSLNCPKNCLCVAFSLFSGCCVCWLAICSSFCRQPICTLAPTTPSFSFRRKTVFDIRTVGRASLIRTALGMLSYQHVNLITQSEFAVNPSLSFRLQWKPFMWFIHCRCWHCLGQWLAWDNFWREFSHW